MANVEVLRYTHVNWRPYAALGVGIFVASIGVIFIRSAQLEGIPTIALVTIRLMLTVSILTPVVFSRYRDQLRCLKPLDLLLTIVAGVMFGMGIITGFEALNHTTVLIAGVLGASVPLWTAFLERGILKTHISRTVWIGMILALAGSLVISMSGLGTGMGINPLLGGALSLTSALVTAVYYIVGRSVRPHMSLVPYIWLVCSFALITTLLITLVTHTSLLGYSVKGYFWIIMVTLGPQLIVQSSYSYVLAYLSATFVGLVTQLVTVGNAIAALIVFHQVPLPVQVAGSAIILAGVALANIRQNQG